MTGDLTFERSTSRKSVMYLSSGVSQVNRSEHIAADDTLQKPAFHTCNNNPTFHGNYLMQKEIVCFAMNDRKGKRTNRNR